MGEPAVEKPREAPHIMKLAVVAVLLGLTLSVLVDFFMMKDDYMMGYLHTKTGVDTSIGSKRDFLVRYQGTLEGSTEIVNEFAGMQGINISEDLFSATAIRLNTEIYELAAKVLSEDFMAGYFGSTKSEIARTAKEHVSPLMFVCLAAGESGTWNDRDYTWVPAVFSKPLSEKLDMDDLCISDVDSKLYWDNGLQDYFRCNPGSSGHTADDVSLHYPKSDSSICNDADSLGPLQILRRYMSLDSGAEGKTVAERLQYALYHLNIKGADGHVLYTIGDLMRWEDNVVWAFDNFMKHMRAQSAFRPDYCIETEYELVCMIAISHNTGASYLVNVPNNQRPSSWSSKDAVYDFCRLVGSAEAVAYIQTEYIEPWYNDVKDRIKAGNAWGMPGNQYFEGSGNQKDKIMRKILEQLGVSFTGGSTYPLNCEYWNRTSTSGSDHKFRYPMKTLFNYLALQKLYTSGEE